eukprot:1126629-Prymnesium_polylepis.2
MAFSRFGLSTRRTPDFCVRICYFSHQILQRLHLAKSCSCSAAPAHTHLALNPSTPAASATPPAGGPQLLSTPAAPHHAPAAPPRTLAAP